MADLAKGTRISPLIPYDKSNPPEAFSYFCKFVAPYVIVHSEY